MQLATKNYDHWSFMVLVFYLLSLFSPVDRYYHHDSTGEEIKYQKKVKCHGETKFSTALTVVELVCPPDYTAS